MTDYSPAGFDAREALARAVVAAVEAATPVDDREAAAQDAFLERTRLEIELEEAGVNRSRMSVLWSPLHEIRGVFDLMPTEGEEAVAAIAARLAAVPAALEGLRVTLSDEARKGNVVAARQYAEVAEQVRRWTGQTGDAGDFYLGLVDRLDGGDPAELRALAGAASAATAAFGLFLSDELEPQGTDKEGVGREVYALASRYFLGAEVDLDETYAWGWTELQRLSDLMDATADRILPGADVDGAVAHLDADPDAGGARARGVPRLDAGARRPHHRGDGRRPLRHPRPDPPHRVHARAHQRRRHLLHRPVRGLRATGPDVVVGARRHRRLPPVARGHDRLPRGRARPPPPGRPDGLPQRHPQPLAAADVLVQRARRGLGALRRAADGGARLPRRPGRPARHARRPVAARRARHRRHRHAPRARPSPRTTASAPAAPPSTPARRGRPSSAWSSCGCTAGWTTSSSSSRSSATSASPARRRPTRSASGSGSRPAPPSQERQGDDFDLKAFHRAALDLGSLGLDPLRAALERL